MGKLKLLESVSRKDILENTKESTEIKIFTLIDSILSGSHTSFLPLLRKYAGTGEDLEFLHTLLGTIRNAGLYAGLVIGGVSPKLACESLALKDFVVRKYMALPAARLSAFSGLYIHLCKADVYAKTGQLV